MYSDMAGASVLIKTFKAKKKKIVFLLLSVPKLEFFMNEHFNENVFKLIQHYMLKIILNPLRPHKSRSRIGLLPQKCNYWQV